MNKTSVLLALFVALVLGTGYVQFNNTPIQQKEAITLFSAKQTVSYDGKSSVKTAQIKMGSTALQLLSTTHSVIQKGQKENAFVTSIDGRASSADNKEFWAFYVNGKQAEVGAGSYILKNNDTIEWKIETY